MEVVAERPSVRVTNIPQTITAKEILQYLVAQLGKDSVFAIEISTVRKNWNSRGFGRVQFSSLEVKHEALSLSLKNKLVLKSQNLQLSETYDDIIPRPVKYQNRMENGVLYVGFMKKETTLCVLEYWEGVRGWFMPERRRIEFWIRVGQEFRYKLVVEFEDILEAVGYPLDGDKVNAVVLKVWFFMGFVWIRREINMVMPFYMEYDVDLHLHVEFFYIIIFVEFLAQLLNRSLGVEFK
jgi:RNA-dependent RNA polymerase